MTSPADTLNQHAAAAQAATDARERAEKNRDRLNAELERERASVAKAETKREAAIEQSISDPDVTIPRVDRNALEIAERKAAAADRMVQAAQETEREAMQRLPGACAAFESQLIIEAAQNFSAEASKIKALAALCALQGSDAARAALHDAGFRIGRDVQGNMLVTRNLIVSIPAPKRVPSLPETCAAELAKYPAARAFYSDAAEREQAQAKRDREMRLREVGQRHDAEIARLEARHASDTASMGAVARAAAQARYLTERAKLTASHMAERAQI